MAARVTAGVLALILSTGTALSAPKPDLWQYWEASDETAATTVDHSAWTSVLSTHIKPENGLNHFDYATAADSAGTRERLGGYIASLSAVDPRTLSRAEQMPYWINLYNALTVNVVLENWPVASIRDISDGFFSSGPWKRDIVEVAGKKLSLNDIEHRILRPIYNDPRVHYAVNCASIGCPDLQSVAFTAANTEELLDKGAREFINSPRGVIVSGTSLTVSSIYDWFVVDFGGNDAGVIAHLKQYAEPALASALGNVRKIARDQYDWGINAVPGSVPGKVLNGSEDDGARGGAGS